MLEALLHRSQYYAIRFVEIKFNTIEERTSKRIIFYYLKNSKDD